MYQIYWIRTCLQVIPVYFLIDVNINYLFQTEQRTSARGSIDGLFREKTPLIVLLQQNAPSNVPKNVYTLLKSVFFPSNSLKSSYYKFMRIPRG